MTAWLLGAAWAALVGWGAWRWRPPAARARALRPRDEAVPAGAGVSGARLVAGVAPAIGRLAATLLRRPVDDVAAARIGRALLAGAVCAAAWPPAGPLVAAATWAAPGLSARRAEARHDAAVERDLPDVVDLLVLAVSAGHTVATAITAVAPRCRGAVGDELRRVVREVAVGRSLADALDDLPRRLGEPVRPVSAALLAAERYGAPLLAALDRVGDDLRHARRRRAEEAARRIPVKLLFPLVCCTLPAFALLTVAPLLAGGLRSLRL